MDIPRDVLMDLLPVYAAGEASAATRALVEAEMARDPSLAAHVRALGAAELPGAGAAPRAEVELESLRRTRAALGLQRWLFALAIVGLATGGSLRLDFAGGRLLGAHLLVLEHPLVFGVPLVLGSVCYLAYRLVRARARVLR